MKVLIISPGYLPITGNHGGAIENLINIYLEHNEKVGDDITVYTVKNSDTMYDKQIYKNTRFRTIDKTKLMFKVTQKIINLFNKFIPLSFTKNYIRLVVNDIIKRKEENYYDLIIFENGQNFIKYFRKKIVTTSKTVLHLHNDYLNSETKDANIIFSLFDEIWTVSKYIKNRVDEIEYIDEKVKVLYNTIDYSSFRKKITANEKKELNKLYNLDGSFVFLYVGRVMADKGTLELVKAFLNLNKRFSNIKLLIVGGNKSLLVKDSYVEKVHNISANNSNIVFTGQINNKELYKYYQLADVQIVPSIWNEAFGLIVLEGVCSNLPIIASNSGGIPEILDKNSIIDRNDIVNELERKMESMLIDKNDLDKYTNNYDEIMKKFSKEKYCETFNNLINGNSVK